MHRIAIILESITMSLQNIRANRTRSFLTMLGIIIGVGSVIAMVNITNLATESIMGEFAGMGAGRVTVFASESPLKPGLNEGDLERLKALDGVRAISPSMSETTITVAQKKVFKETTVEGRDNEFFRMNDLIKKGRGFLKSDMSGNSYVCIIDKKYAGNAFPGMNPLGHKIKIHGISHTIVGIFSADNNMSMTDSTKSDGSVLIPYPNALNMAGKAVIDTAEVYLKEGYDNADVSARLRAELRKIYNVSETEEWMPFSVMNMESLISSLEASEKMLGLMVAGIASIALVVGGIGIMNMMLVSVTERTKEIGLRKALGAEPFRIQMQFLIESVVLSLVGGVIGIIIGISIGAIAALIMKVHFVPSMSSVLIGFGFSVGVGMVFGWMPARRASSLNPIDALRSE